MLVTCTAHEAFLRGFSCVTQQQHMQLLSDVKGLPPRSTLDSHDFFLFQFSCFYIYISQVTTSIKIIRQESGFNPSEACWSPACIVSKSLAKWPFNDHQNQNDDHEIIINPHATCNNIWWITQNVTLRWLRASWTHAPKQEFIQL